MVCLSDGDQSSHQEIIELSMQISRNYLEEWKGIKWEEDGEIE